MSACSLIEDMESVRWRGRVVEASDVVVESEGPVCSVGEVCFYGEDGAMGEVVGFRGRHVLSVPLAGIAGVRFGMPVFAQGERPSVRISHEMIGRTVDACGRALDGGPEIAPQARVPLHRPAPRPFERTRITTPLQTGVRAIDGFLTCGRGQRVGIFGGSGVGKSTLIGMMSRNTEADLTVLALVGERGREVQEFIDTLGEGMRRSVVVVSTSDQSPLLRVRAALTATAIAEFFAAQGKHVLLVVDSVTRFAMAQREIGLAAGEFPTSRGYTPSVFRKLSELLERAGSFPRGSITAFYSVLMEGDDQQDILVDSVRSILDGHIMLDRQLAAEGHYPPIQVLDSISRLMTQVASPEHRAAAVALRRCLSLYRENQDLIRIGAYSKGSDPELDRAIGLRDPLRTLLMQRADDSPTLDQAFAALRELAP